MKTVSKILELLKGESETKNLPGHLPDQDDMPIDCIETSNDTSTDDEKIIKLMKVLSDCQHDTIRPSINFEENRLSFPSLSDLADDACIIRLLEKLASPQVNVLEKGISERLLACPQHPTHLSTSLRLFCPDCFSNDVVKLHLVEHTTCGYIFESKGPIEDLRSRPCTFCKSFIKNPEKEIRKLGRWYECNKCKVKFDNCVTKLYCRKFDHDFDINQAVVLTIPSYHLKKHTSSLPAYALPLRSHIRNILANSGFTVEESFNVKGSSGTIHRTDIYSYDKNGRTIMIDIACADSTILDSEIHSMIVKALDIHPSVAVFVGIPSVSETAMKFALSHGIIVIEGENFAKITDGINHTLQIELNIH